MSEYKLIYHSLLKNKTDYQILKHFFDNSHDFCPNLDELNKKIKSLNINFKQEYILNYERYKDLSYFDIINKIVTEKKNNRNDQKYYEHTFKRF